jgi:serine/threonine protein kinase
MDKKNNITDFFEFVKKIDEGAYSYVYLAIDRKTQKNVAIKQMKTQYKDWKDCMVQKEILILKTLKHPNIIKLKEVIKDKENLYLIYEYMDMNLLKFYEEYKKKVKIKRICRYRKRK